MQNFTPTIKKIMPLSSKLLCCMLVLCTAAGTLFSQSYEFSLVQRRCFDRIAVEIWAKRLSDSAPRIGGASLILSYDTRYLLPSATQSVTSTDTINSNVNRANPVDNIVSPFSISANGFDAPESQSYSSGYYSLEIKQRSLGNGGVLPAKTGLGTFVGKLMFDIVGAPTDNSLTGIDFSRNVMPGDLVIFDYNGEDIESACVFTEPENFTVLGITVLSPAHNGQVVDRDYTYASLAGDYYDGGYPIYFERSVNPAAYFGPVDEDLGYLLEYSIDDGATWSNIGRVSETTLSSSSINNNAKYRSGEIYSPNKSTAYTICSQSGERLDATNFRNPVRVIWSKNQNFTERSEQARLRITRLAGYSNMEILSRSSDNSFGVSPASFALGRLFFLQLNGNSQYVRSPENVSNSTQLTVEAWVNINELKPVGSETGIVVSSAGANATPIFGSTEGSWMLYLKDGRIPAFRVREIQGRSKGGYLASVQANYLDSLLAVSSVAPLSVSHSENWMHLAATVKDNTVSLYVNGELVDKVVNTEATDMRMLPTTHPVWIGLNPNGTIEQSDYLNAGIKEVKVWKVALSQDELRHRVSGVYEPSNVATYGDLRRGLQLYYSFEGILTDLANDNQYQSGNETALYFAGNVQSSDMVYRPDRPHVRLTAPTAGSGISTRDGSVTEIRWVAYGLGNIGRSGSRDLDIEYSTDNGDTWFFARDNAGKTLGGTGTPVDVENGSITWAIRNDAPSPDIKTISPFARNAVMRVRGTEANGQGTLGCVSGEFVMAPDFAVCKDEATMIVLADKSGMNITGNTAFIEAWVRPYRFPTEAEGFFPIVTKIDSVSRNFHYDFGILPEGNLRFRVMDNNGDIHSTTSSMTLVRPNSVALDSVWSHVGVYVFLNNGTGSTETRFYIDGIADLDSTATTGLGSNLALNIANEYPVYIGYYPSVSTTETGNVYAGGSQTRNIDFVGNINAENDLQSVSAYESQVYDNLGLVHTLTANLTKLDSALFEYNFMIDGLAIPWTTTEINLLGNLDYSATVGTIDTASTTIYSNNGSSWNLDFFFTKNPTVGLYDIKIAYQGTELYSGRLQFNPNGTVKSPMNLEFSAVRMNTLLNSGIVFDTVKKQTMIVNFAGYGKEYVGLTNYYQNTNIVANDAKRTISFNLDGTLKTPKTIELESFYVNKILAAESFDSNLPKNIVVALENEALGTSMTNKYLPTSLALSGQDGLASTTVSGNVTVTSDTSRGFAGELREIRFWNGTPNATGANSAAEPTEMTLFVQGAQAINAEKLTNANNANLYSVYPFSGGTFVVDGWSRSASKSVMNNAIARYFGTPIRFKPTVPYIKLVEPAFKQNVANMATDVRVRWVGFNYDGEEFLSGTSSKAPSLEFSIRGGGGQLIQPYQFVGSDYWKGNPKDAISIPNTNLYRFSGTGSPTTYAMCLDASIADPDEKKDGTMKQGPLSASLTNARLRLTGVYTIFSQSDTLRSEGPLFSITPASNFTIRAVLEGHHEGAVGGKAMANIGTSFENGGVRIKLYKDIGTIGDLVATRESTTGYDILDPANKNSGNYRFANINYVFTDLTDGNYWVLVEHMNHLPVMSRYPATFLYTGDERSTWRIESGWDFSSWNGTDDNVLMSQTADPTQGLYTAYGYAKKTATDVNYSVTGLIYNDGRAGGNTRPIAALVGGDVNSDWQINAADRVQVREDDGTGLLRSDVTGDGYVNADDRTITDRNFGHVASVYDVTFPTAETNDAKVAPKEYIDPHNTALSNFFVDNARKAKAIVSDKEAVLQASLNYEVSAEPVLLDNQVELRFYIKNIGSDFSPANCTFPVKYNSSVLEFAGLKGADSVLFSSNAEVGYADLRTAPTADAIDPLPDVRTIEIDYDAYANLGGLPVPREKTYLGSLLFKLKSKNGAVTFTWHDSKSVHTTNNQLATEYGKFITIDPIMLYSAALTSPNGGEKLSQGRKQNVTWTTNGDALVSIYFTSNRGITWEKITETPININLHSFEWTTPEINSSSCLMKIVDSETEFEIDQSDATFSIVAPFAQISRPSTADPVYIGGKTDAIKWTASGLDNIRFEFSPDAGETWTSISTAISSTIQSNSWKIPGVTTKTAQIRMIDTETDKVVAKTGFFKILNGSLTFKSPVQQEKLLANKSTRIRWTSSNVEDFDLQLSLNGGNNWTSLFTSVAGAVSYQNWDIPDTSSDYCVIRAIWNGDPEMEYARTGIFTIIANSSVEDRLPAGVEFSAITPNPASDYISLNLNSDFDFAADVQIVDYAGRCVKNFGSADFYAGTRRLTYDVTSLASGKYFLIFKSSNFVLTREIIVK
ncbi:MAG: T9SS type A sorting domain-containing protein [Candidatus Kapabacteria bacterium]|nr:T9SS type A sorting domain-containing protein [Candidatus Kapabacteria bacterium]